MVSVGIEYIVCWGKLRVKNVGWVEVWYWQGRLVSLKNCVMAQWVGSVVMGRETRHLEWGWMHVWYSWVSRKTDEWDSVNMAR